MKKDIKDIFDYYSDDAIEFKEAPQISPENIYRLTKNKLGKDDSALKRTNKKFSMGLIAAAVCVVMTITAFAAIYFLSPAEVAKEFGDTKLAEVFEKDESTIFNVAPQESNGYSIDILGVASGKDLSSFTQTENDRTYIVGSIAKADGKAISDYTELMISPLVSGYEPWRVNIFTLTDGAKHTFIKDGVEYFLVESSNVSIFADHTVYIAVYEGLAPSAEIFKLNNDGSISFADEYDKTKALFTLPLDKALADSEAVNELLGADEGDEEELTAEDLKVEQTTDADGTLNIDIKPVE